MEALQLLEDALVAGAAVSVKDTASMAVKDAYAALRSLVLKAVRDKHADADPQTALAQVVAVEQYPTAPDTWRVPARAAITAAGADTIPEILTAARALLALTDPEGSAAGKYTITVHGGQGHVIGDNNHVQQTFNGPPPRA